ncbi:hypothetical protein [Pseudomonas putida]|uniref:hypothetical protein n=1 Tax=Pseudomonas putida TaxID=303 RepID=UPI0018D7E540|nr:hypothetical protein [Pseudomonas putida]GJB79488.1 hypothetical protein KAM380_039530 [Aeromonas caviae]MBH3419926.1 hypothetical protein [Pseudomonas putida]MDD2068334.1 hypothetical protein [Pseudomonas putida]MDG9818095.1 hypothetical protein [Pseudomonas putida]HDS1741419.1 hypothetical protein [Pseudomonas putida]
MKENPKKPSPLRRSTFDKYVAERSAHIELIIEQSLRHVNAKKFSNLTDYCKSLAAVVSDIRAAKAGDPTTPFFNKTVKPFSYVTLLRNEKYRQIVQGMYDHSRQVMEQPQAISEDASIKIASLQGQINLLKDRLSGTKTNGGSNALADAEAQTNIVKLSEFLIETLRVYTEMRTVFSSALKLVSEPTAKHPIIGLYSSYGLIAEAEALQKIEEGRKFVDKLARPLNLAGD